MAISVVNITKNGFKVDLTSIPEETLQYKLKATAVDELGHTHVAEKTIQVERIPVDTVTITDVQNKNFVIDQEGASVVFEYNMAFRNSEGKTPNVGVKSVTAISPNSNIISAAATNEKIMLTPVEQPENASNYTISLIVTLNDDTTFSETFDVRMAMGTEVTLPQFSEWVLTSDGGEKEFDLIFNPGNFNVDVEVVSMESNNDKVAISNVSLYHYKLVASDVENENVTISAVIKVDGVTKNLSSNFDVFRKVEKGAFVFVADYNSGSVRFYKRKFGNASLNAIPDIEIEYCIVNKQLSDTEAENIIGDDYEWTKVICSSSAPELVISVGSNKSILIRSDSLDYLAVTDDDFENGAYYAVYGGTAYSGGTWMGNIYALLKRGKMGEKIAVGDYFKAGFFRLWSECKKALSYIELNQCVESGYAQMCKGSFIEYGPKFNFEVIKRKMCYEMFKGCNKLVNCARSVYGNEIEEYGCYGMFENASLNSLTMTCTKFGNYACKRMFYNCKSIVTFIADVIECGMSSFESCFENCTSIRNGYVSNNNLISIGGSAFKNMFKGCTALLSINNLEVNVSASNCYDSMFAGCTSLNTGDIYIRSSSSYCCQKMFFGCTSFNGNIKFDTESLNTGNFCFDSIIGNTLVDHIVCLVKVAGSGTFTGLFTGTVSGGTFAKNPEINEENCRSLFGVKNDWTIVDYVEG